jgi:hypothetical protein
MFHVKPSHGSLRSAAPLQSTTDFSRPAIRGTRPRRCVRTRSIDRGDATAALLEPSQRQAHPRGAYPYGVAHSDHQGSPLRFSPPCVPDVCAHPMEGRHRRCSVSELPGSRDPRPTMPGEQTPPLGLGLSIPSRGPYGGAARPAGDSPAAPKQTCADLRCTEPMWSPQCTRNTPTNSAITQAAPVRIAYPSTQDSNRSSRQGPYSAPRKYRPLQARRLPGGARLMQSGAVPHKAPARRAP